MKRINIMYQMSIDHSRPSDNYPHNVETVEACITLPMRDEIAEDILRNQTESCYVVAMSGNRNVFDVLYYLANIQGYTTVAFCCAEAAE